MGDEEEASCLFHLLTRAQFASLNSLPGIKGIANELGDEEEVSCLFVQGCKQGGAMQRYDITENKKKIPSFKVFSWFKRLKLNLLPCF